MKSVVNFRPILSTSFAIGVLAASLASILWTKEGKISFESEQETSAVFTRSVLDGKVINLSVTPRFLED